MASFCKVTREFSKLSTRPIRHHAFVRGFRNNPMALAAQNLTMPAMSPTMTEGNITSWTVKEGDSFIAGDVLLEIETDKAQMDVEAQEDGKMAKITQQAGAKGIKVGTRIAVLAETNDDLSSLSIPAEGSAPILSPQDPLTPGVDPSESSESQADAPPASKSHDAPAEEPSNAGRPQRTSGKPQKQTYPLYPSIAQLFHEKGIPASEADKIPASGPKGRLLKGDVLAYLGTISSSYSSDQSARILKLGHLDLSNVKPAPGKKIPALPQSKAPIPQAAEPEQYLDTEIAVPISLSTVISVQKRLQATLGVTLPLSTFIARATELANDDLPRFAAPSPTADELFNDVLGLNAVSSRTSRGGYVPQITALPNKPFTEGTVPQRQPDVYDILTDNASSKPSNSLGLPPQGIMAGSKRGDATNVFSVSASRGEEKRARVFLERVKTILQVEPGRLIL